MNTRLISSNGVINALPQWWLGIAYLLLSNHVFAELLKDPTQPPAALYNQTYGDQAGEPLNGPVLQSIMLGSNYHAAIINGQKIMLGQKYDGATLIKLNEHQAVLRNPDKSLKILTMDFGIKKKILPTKGQALPSRKILNPNNN